MDFFLKRLLPVLIIVGSIAAGYWFRNAQEPAPAPPVPVPPAVRSTLSQAADTPPLRPVLPKIDEEEPAPSPSESPEPLTDTDPCHADNAQDLWYRIAREYSPQIMARNFHFAAAEGRTLLIRQQWMPGAKPFVQITAQWYGRNDAAETVPKELLNETRFLEPHEIAEVAGPAWMERVTDGHTPIVTEDAFQLSSTEESVTMRNGVAYNLRVKRNGKNVSCEKDQSCRCN